MRSLLLWFAVTVAVGVVPAGQVSAAAPSAKAPPTIDVAIRSMRYDPVELVIPQGTRVQWSNVATPSRAHDVRSSLPGYIASPLMVRGNRFRYTFGAAGTFTYICSIHDVMIGSVEVPLKAQLVTTGSVPYFRLTLGTRFLPASSYWRYVLEWQTPGGPDWQIKSSRDNTLVVLATTPGTYSFRARLRNRIARAASANTPVVTMEYAPAS